MGLNLIWLLTAKLGLYGGIGSTFSTIDPKSIGSSTLLLLIPQCRISAAFAKLLM